MATDDKFITFKRDEFERCMHALNLEVPDSIIKDITDRQLDDAVVIRTHDILAGPVLHVYANVLGMTATLNGAISTRRIADYFHERAVEADAFAADGVAHLPD